MATEPSTKNEANNLSIIGFININPFAIIIKIINLYLIKFFVSCLKKDFIFNSVYFKSFKIQSILSVLAKIIEKANKYGLDTKILKKAIEILQDRLLDE